MRILSLIFLILFGSGRLLSAVEAVDEPSTVDDTAAVAQQATEDEAPSASEEDPEIVAMRQRLERLQLVRQLEEAETQAALVDLFRERQRLEAEMSLDQQRRQQALADLMAEREQLDASAALRQAQLQAELHQARAELERRQLVQQQRRDAIQGRQIEHEAELQEVRMEMEQMQLQEMREQQSERKAAAELRAIDLRQEQWRKRREIAALVEHPIERPVEPFADGVLTISDRRIEMDAPIIRGVADWICNRIDFFNNQSNEEPIFLVIGYCGGGSILEGARIIRSMHASKAPIHVVVKGFAASMAAIIVAEADESYAYPDALIVHHQPMSIAWGNVAQQKRDLAWLERWGKRLHRVVAERMGITVEELWERCYKEDPDGDWMLFGDDAQAINWLDHVAREIREDAVVRQPEDDFPYQRWLFQQQAPAAADQAVIQHAPLPLPAPLPGDYYFLYNRNNAYRIVP